MATDAGRERREENRGVDGRRMDDLRAVEISKAAAGSLNNVPLTHVRPIGSTRHPRCTECQVA